MIRAAVFVSRHFTAFACLFFALGWAERIGEIWLTGDTVWRPRLARMTHWLVNYPEDGFLARGLVGTLLRPVMQGSTEPRLLTFWLMVALACATFVALVWAVRRFLPHDAEGGVPAILRAALAIGSAGVAQIASDYGRFDHLNYFVAGAAIWLALRGRALEPALLCVAGVLIHEGFFVYAVPLIVALLWCLGGIPRALPAAACSVAAAAAVYLYGASESAAARRGGGVWSRGVIEYATGLAWYEAAVLAGYWALLLALLWWTYRGNGRRPDLLFLAALCPLALNFLGVDHGRWLTIGALVIGTVLVLQVRQFGFRWPDLSVGKRRTLCLLALPLSPHGQTGAWSWFF